MMNNFKSHWGLYLSFLFISIVVFILSSNAIWLGDDITYRYHWKTGEEITSVADSFSSQLVHYMEMNGRFVAHFMVQIAIALLGQPAFALLNVLLYIALVLIVLKVIGIPYSDHRKVILLTLLILFGFQTKYVPSCQIGYIWMFVIVMGYILLFFKNQKKFSRWHSLWLVPFGVFAGWSQEAIVIGVSVALIIYVLINWRQITFNQWAMFFSFGVGAMLLCFSPGTLSRTSEIHGSVDFLPPFVYSLFKLCFYLRITYILIFYVLYLLFIKKVKFKELYCQGAFFIISMFTLIIFNVGVGVFGNRQLFGVELMALVLLLKYICIYGRNSKFYITLTSVLLCFVVYTTIQNLRFLKHEHELYDYLVTEYKKSDDGIVYYDFMAKDVTFYETYPSDVFTEYVLSTISRFEKSKNNLNNNIKVLPTCFEDTSGDDIWCNPKAGTFNVVLNKDDNSSRSFVQKRALYLLGKRIAIKDKIYDEKSAYFEKDNRLVWVIYDKFPFVETEEIIIN